jgi:hypothetical protein
MRGHTDPYEIEIEHNVRKDFEKEYNKSLSELKKEIKEYEELGLSLNYVLPSHYKKRIKQEAKLMKLTDKNNKIIKQLRERINERVVKIQTDFARDIFCSLEYELNILKLNKLKTRVIEESRYIDLKNKYLNKNKGVD